MELDDLIRRRDQLNQQLMIHCSNKGSSPAHAELLTIEGALAYLRHHGLEDARPSSLVCDLTAKGQSGFQLNGLTIHWWDCTPRKHCKHSVAKGKQSVNGSQRR